MDCSAPGSSVHGILQARILERVAMPSSRGSSQPRHRTQVSHIADGFFRLSHQGSPYVSIITLNINGLNAPTKRHRLAGQVKRAFMHFHLPHHSAWPSKLYVIILYCYINPSPIMAYNYNYLYFFVWLLIVKLTNIFYNCDYVIITHLIPLYQEWSAEK